jgi:hypothetical protein
VQGQAQAANRRSTRPTGLESRGTNPTLHKILTVRPKDAVGRPTPSSLIDGAVFQNEPKCQDGRKQKLSERTQTSKWQKMKSRSSSGSYSKMSKHGAPGAADRGRRRPESAGLGSGAASTRPLAGDGRGDPGGCLLRLWRAPLASAVLRMGIIPLWDSSAILDRLLHSCHCGLTPGRSSCSVSRQPLRHPEAPASSPAGVPEDNSPPISGDSLVRNYGFRKEFQFGYHVR